MFNGLKPVVIALVIVALQTVARKAVRGPIQAAVAVATFAEMFFFEASLLVVMLTAIALGIVLTAVRPGLLHRPGGASAEEDKNEESYYIHRGSAATKPVPLLWPTMKLARLSCSSGWYRCRCSTSLWGTSIFGGASRCSLPRPPS